jgi:hypothetical protein
MSDVVESRWCETFFGEHILCGVQQERASVLEASFPCPPLDHAKKCAGELVLPDGAEMPVIVPFEPGR